MFPSSVTNSYYQYNNYINIITISVGSPGGSMVKNPPASVPVSGRSPGEGNGNPLQYSCLENPSHGPKSLQSLGSQSQTPENRAYEKENKEKVKLYHKIWREEHKEIILEKAKEQRIKHREKHIEASKRWAEEHKDQIAERRRQRIAENPEYYKAKSRAWKEANREKCREYCRKYREKKKAQENPEAFIDVISNQD